MNLIVRKIAAIVLVLGTLLYIPYALYNAKTAADKVASAAPVRAIIIAHDQITCQRPQGKYSSHTCALSVIVQTNTTPSWTGSVVAGETSGASAAAAKHEAEQELLTLKLRDPLALHAITSGSDVSYIYDGELESLKRKGDPTNNLYLLLSPLFIALGVAAFFDKLSRRW